MHLLEVNTSPTAQAPDKRKHLSAVIFFRECSYNFHVELDIKINRRKLSAAGKTTYFKITVSNKQLKIKRVYEVEVFRENADKSTTVKSKSKSKSNSQKDKNNVKNNSPNSLHHTDNLNENDYSEESTENIVSNDSSNGYPNIYLIASLSVVSLGFISYISYEFIKYRKNANFKCRK